MVYYPYNYRYAYYPYYYDYYYTAGTDPAPKTFDLKVDTNPPGIAAVNGRGTYNSGSVATFSLTSLIVPSGSNQRYVFLSWSGDFSGATPSATVVMDSAKNVVANYELQNYLKVSVDPPGIVAATGEGWYRSGESVTLGSVPLSESGSQGVRYIFQGWSVDALPVSGNSIEVTMDVPHTVEAQYKTQYLLTVSSEYGTVQGEGWYDAGSSATFSVTTPIDTSYGVKQVFDRWAGDSESTSPTTTITMDSPRTVMAVWRTDNTVLYTTIALGIGAAFVLGIGLTAIAITRTSRAKPVPETSLPRVATVETAEPAAKKLKRTQARKRSKPKADQPEPPSETSS